MQSLHEAVLLVTAPPIEGRISAGVKRRCFSWYKDKKKKAPILRGFPV